MKDHLHVPILGKYKRFSVFAIVLLQATIILFACGQPPTPSPNPPVNNNGTSSTTNSYNNTNSCNGSQNCTTTINIINQNSGDWQVTVNQASLTVSYNGYSTDSNHQFIIVDASFQNVSSGRLILNGALFSLQDSSGQQYTEDQASNPGNSFPVDPNQTITTETAFVVPDNQCTFTLSFIGSTNSNAQWSIGTCQGKGNIQSFSLTA